MNHDMDSFDDTPVVDLNQLRQKVAEAQSEKADSINRIKLSLRHAPTGEVVSGQVLPITNELRTQVLKLHAESSAQPPQSHPAQELKASAGAGHSTPQCPGCGSYNTKRRHRTVLERAAFTLTNHRAFNCQDCSGSFYAKSDAEGDSMNGTDIGLFDPSALNAEHKR